MKLRLFSSLAVPLLAFGIFGVAKPAAADQAYILSQLNNKCMDAQSGSSASGTPVIMWSCHGQSNQKLEFTRKGEIRLLGKCLDAAGGRGANGDRIVLWDCHGGANQKWRLSSNGLIRGINNRCIDIANGNARDGAGLVLWDCHGGSNQRWTKGINKSAASVGLTPNQVEKAYQMSHRNGAASIISTGGGNIIATGGGNVIAPASGIISTGGGNVIAPGDLR